MFILLDRPDETHDRMISEHIMRTHALASSGSDKGGRTTGTGGTGGPTGKINSDTISSSQSQSARREGVDQSTLSQRLRRVVEQYEEHPLGSQMHSHSPSQSQHDAGGVTFNT